jgi:hypothetical protein
LKQARKIRREKTVVRNLALLALIIGSGAGCGRPPAARTPDGVLSDPLPPLPAWVNVVIGKSVEAAFPGANETCIGFLDRIEARYSGNNGGIQVAGWGWSSSGNHTYARLIAVDEGGIIRGGGEGGINREDVPTAIPSVTDARVGFSILSEQTDGTVRVFGVADDSACQLGSPLPIN